MVTKYQFFKWWWIFFFPLITYKTFTGHLLWWTRMTSYKNKIFFYKNAFEIILRNLLIRWFIYEIIFPLMWLYYNAYFMSMLMRKSFLTEIWNYKKKNNQQLGVWTSFKDNINMIGISKNLIVLNTSAFDTRWRICQIMQKLFKTFSIL